MSSSLFLFFLKFEISALKIRRLINTYLHFCFYEFFLCSYLSSQRKRGMFVSSSSILVKPISTKLFRASVLLFGEMLLKVVSQPTHAGQTSAAARLLASKNGLARIWFCDTQPLSSFLLGYILLWLDLLSSILAVFSLAAGNMLASDIS